MGTIIQWNCNGITNNGNEMKQLIMRFQPLVLAIQETHLTANKQFNLKQYNVIRMDYTLANQASGGVALYIKNTLFFQQIALTTNLQAVAAQITIDPFPKVTICNIYMPQHTVVRKEDTANNQSATTAVHYSMRC